MDLNHARPAIQRMQAGELVAREMLFGVWRIEIAHAHAEVRVQRYADGAREPAPGRSIVGLDDPAARVVRSKGHRRDRFPRTGLSTRRQREDRGEEIYAHHVAAD